MIKRAAFLGALMASPVMAQQEAQDFVQSNIIGIFYHELGHALIDIEGIPIFGQEEDAADVFSIFLIDAMFEEESALDLAYDASFGFLGEAILRGGDAEDVAWWDVHGPDEQRFYNTVCLFYGADPEAREDFAQDMDLPQERADYCPDEYDAASQSWGGIMEDLMDRGAGTSIRFEGSTATPTHEWVAEEVTALNENLTLSAPLTVRVEACGEANAFYDSNDQSITVCTEFADHLFEMFDQL
ncbi:MAG: DUF4344 domain-containing metallopeptidase [Pelagimonas sp.]|jgi:hypothetical protein|nr:DUF4344 domain-containing metallopeptidase [Pelagimonas sp.]